jgi:hypothetical protein
VPLDHFIIKDTFTVADKLNLKKHLSSNWLTLTSSDWIASVGKALDDSAVLIILTDGAKWSEKLKCETMLAGK